MFYTNIRIMNNYRNYKSSVIQLLVHNYLTHEYKTRNVYIYPELVNDLDIFTTDISTIEELTVEGKINVNMDIRAMLDIVSDEYVQSCEIKSGHVYDEPSKNRLFDFANLLQLISKIYYPINTKLLLILVPNTYDFQTDMLIDVKSFEKLKGILLSESDEDKRKMFNILTNDESYRKRDINSALASIIGISKKHALDACIERLKKVKHTYAELSDEDYNALIRNFEKAELKVLTLHDLEKYPLSSDVVKSLLSLF